MTPLFGVDPHRDRHAAALLDPNGGVRATLRGRPWRQRVRARAGLVAMPSDPVEHRATVGRYA